MFHLKSSGIHIARSHATIARQLAVISHSWSPMSFRHPFFPLIQQVQNLAPVATVPRFVVAIVRPFNASESNRDPL
jgi:hypothetical protein